MLNELRIRIRNAFVMQPVPPAAMGCLSLLAIASAAFGIYRGLGPNGGIDSQWAGSQLLWHHIDIWQEALKGYPHHYEHFTQPNYLHQTYVLLGPLSLLNWHAFLISWCILNVALTAGCTELLRRIFKLADGQAFLLLILFWLSSPFRQVLLKGQMSMVELLLFCIAFSRIPAAASGLAFGLSFAKYSFSPLAGFMFLVRRRWILVFALIVPFLGLLAASSLLGESARQVAPEPFVAAQYLPRGVDPGFADVMTFASRLLENKFAVLKAQHIAYILGLTSGALYILFVSRFRLSRGEEFALLAIATLFFIQHLAYDLVFLAVPLAYGLGSSERRVRLPVIGGVLLFWIAGPLLGRAITAQGVRPGLYAINISALGCLLVYATYVILSPARAQQQQELILKAEGRPVSV